MANLDNHSESVAAALDMIQDGFNAGLGSGRAATAFVEALGERVRQGLRIQGVPTSRATAELMTRMGIPFTTLDQVEMLDITVDGADEVAPNLDLIKGLGGALVREKIVAESSRRLVILVGAEKLVSHIGEHGIVPVEVVPFGLSSCSRRLARLGVTPVLRLANGEPLVTDNGNRILDCHVPILPNPGEFEQAVRSISGVVGTGLFLGIAQTVLVQDGASVRVMTRT